MATASNPTNELKNLQVIRASAGSGKTYQLAFTFIKHLLGVRVHDGECVRYRLRHNAGYHQHMLAITFTNKATNEMKSRIIAQLYKLSQGEGDYVEAFKQLFVDDFDDVRRAARAALAHVLFHYSQFNVSTIDSFFQGIVRAFTRELNAVYNYELQLDDEYATSVAVSETMRQVGDQSATGKALEHWMRDYVRDNVNNNRSWKVFGGNADLLAFAANLNKEFYRAHREQVKNYLADVGDPQGSIARFNLQLKASGDALHKRYCQLGQQVRDFFDCHGLNPEHVVKRRTLTTLLATPADTELPMSSGLERMATEPGRLAADMTKAAGELSDDTCAAFQAMMAQAVDDYNTWQFLDGLRRNIWQMGLLGRIDSQLEQYRHDNNAMLMADTNDLIATALKSGNDFIYEHVGAWLNHYMIDEFQDTSRKQYENFRPLLENSIGSGNQNLIIGDEKQAIYRFRNSDPSMLRDELDRDFGSDVIGGEPLSTNYRSFSAVVNFNNWFFRAAVDGLVADTPQYHTLAKTYRNIHQEVARHDVPGYTRVNFIYDKFPEHVIETPTGNVKGKGYVLDRLPQYLLEITRRGFQPRDVAILVNTRAEGQTVVNRLLEHNKSCQPQDTLPVVSPDSLLLSASRSVRLIVSMLEYLETAHYNEPKTDADSDTKKKWLHRQIQEQRRYKIVHEFNRRMAAGNNDNATPGQVLLQCFEDDNREMGHLDEREKRALYAQATSQVLPKPHTQLGSLANIVENIIGTYLSHVSRQETAFLLAFQDVVLDFMQLNGGGTVREFLSYWNTHSSSFKVGTPEGENAINVMTIHKSKGLQFPCVVVPFASWELQKSDKVMWLSKDLWLKENATGAPFAGVGSTDPHIVPPIIPAPVSKLQKVAAFESFFYGEREKDLVDSLNKTYVAFTRPEQELHVFALMTSHKVDNIAQVSQLLFRHCSTPGGNNPLQVTTGVMPPAKKGEGESEVPLVCEMGSATAMFRKEKSANGDDAVTEPLPPYRVSPLPSALTVALPRDRATR